MVNRLTFHCIEVYLYRSPANGIPMMNELASELPHIASDQLNGMIIPSKTCLTVVDVQKDFTAPDGLVAQYGADMTTVEPTIHRIEKLVEAARKVGVTVVHMRVVTSPETDSEAVKKLYERRGMPGGQAICRKGEGDVYYRIFPEVGDIEIPKLMFNGFHDTELESKLRKQGIDTMLFTGFTTDCCVFSTANDAFHRNFNTFIVSDACSAYEPELHLSALEIMQKNFALLIHTEDVLASWKI